MINWLKRKLGFQTIELDGETISVRNVKDSEITINVDGNKKVFKFDSYGKFEGKPIDLSKLKKEDYYKL